MIQPRYKWRSIFTLVMSILLFVGQCLTSAPTMVSAGDTDPGQEIQATGLSGSDAKVTTKSGVDVSNPTKLTRWDDVNLDYS